MFNDNDQIPVLQNIQVTTDCVRSTVEGNVFHRRLSFCSGVRGGGRSVHHGLLSTPYSES